MVQERNRLTDLAVKNCQAPTRGQRDLFDSKLPGFGLRVSAGGTKSFIVLYRFDGRKVRMTLGRYPILTLAEARVLADNALRLAAHGTNPAAEKKSRLPASDGTIAVEADTATKRTMSATLEEYLEKYARVHNRDWYTKQSVMRREFAERWPTQPLGAITRAMVVKTIDEIVVATCSSTGHTRFAYLQHFFGWCVGRGYIDTSPMERLRSPPKGAARDRVLDDSEVMEIVRAARDMSYPYGHIIEALLLSAQRRDEVAGLRWSELDLERATWTLPALRTKTGKGHLVPLSKRLHELLLKIPRRAGDGSGRPPCRRSGVRRFCSRDCGRDAHSGS